MHGQQIFIEFLLMASVVLFSLGVAEKVMKAPPEKTLRIAVIPKGAANMWWKVVHNGTRKTADEAGVVISRNGSEIETDREKQIQYMEDADRLAIAGKS